MTAIPRCGSDDTPLHAPSTRDARGRVLSSRATAVRPFEPPRAHQRTPPPLEQRAESERARQDSVVRARPGVHRRQHPSCRRRDPPIQRDDGERPSGFVTRRGDPFVTRRGFRSARSSATTRPRWPVWSSTAASSATWSTRPRLTPHRHIANRRISCGRCGPPARTKPLTRLLARFGGRPLGFHGYSCPTRPESTGRRTPLWSGCVVTPRWRRRCVRMFGAIIERGWPFQVSR